ncbi:MAG: NTP transferase domain-containing protein [Oligoflexia bacterium]|nr:NTP transferase domain-containing protein [Oligoflexia bacterium]
MKSLLNVVCLMAGDGSRFTQAGFSVPKPYINYRQKPLFQWALESLSGLRDMIQIHHAVRDHHPEVLRPKDNLIVFENLTRGPADTAKQCVQRAKIKGPVIFLDCDLFFSSPEFEKSMGDNEPMDGAVVTFESSSPRYSFVREFEGRVVEAAEKKVISQNALAGCYYFADAEKFADSTARLLEESNSELFISHVLNVLAKDHLIRSFKTTRYRSFGSPEEFNGT